MNAKRLPTLALLGLLAVLAPGGAGEKKDAGGGQRAYELPKEEGLAVLFVRLPGGRKAEFRVEADKDADVRLFVFDARNKRVPGDEGLRDVRRVSFTPEEAGLYRVALINEGDKDTRATLHYAGEHVRPDLTDLEPFDLKANEKKVFHLAFEAGRPAVLTLQSEKATDVDVFVLGKGKGGKEEPAAYDQRLGKDCLIAFIPVESATYRVEVTNVQEGAKDTRCAVRHSGKEVAGPKTDK